MLSRSSQLAAKIAQESPTCGQDRPKYSLRASNQTSQDPKMQPKRWSLVRFYTSAIFPKIAKKVTKNASRTFPKPSKLTRTWPSWRYHGPSWAQLAANFAHLAPIFAPTSPKISTTSRQKPQEAPPDTPRSPRGSPKSSRAVPGARIFMVLGSISDLIFLSFFFTLSFNSS